MLHLAPLMSVKAHGALNGDQRLGGSRRQVSRNASVTIISSWADTSRWTAGGLKLD
ncbi:hypothetical protein ACQR1I_08680 [Bradyrhizobium sp. HKCCYLS2038]|uniref:hypothetical protein n=1 Tax=unclassified Bradyrhizobium TaxID=2631580 RepID=UPI003EC098C1